MMYKQLIPLTFAFLASLPLQAQKDSTKTQLKEVVVDGQGRVVEKDHVSYMPTKRQKNGANSGVGLLYNMMIPQLDVDKLNGTISSTNGLQVSTYMDGRPVDVSEIKSVRPKDVLRVELYQSAMEKFGQNGMVVNFVMRKYEMGGYVDLRTDTRFIKEQGSYSAMASFDRKKMNYTVLAGTGYAHDHGKGGLKEEHYSLSPEFDKLTDPLSQSVKSKNMYGLFKAAYSDKGLFLVLKGSLQKSDGDMDGNSRTSYSNDIYPASDAFSTMHTRSVSPMGNVFFMKALSQKQTLRGNFTFTYSKNDYDRHYQEGQSWQPVYNSSKEKLYSYDGNIYYKNQLSKKSFLSLSLWGIQTKSVVDYATGSMGRQKLTSGEYLFNPTYTYSSEKLTVSVIPGFNFSSYCVNDEKRVTKVYPRPHLEFYYVLNKNSNVYLVTNMGNTSPSMALLNDGEQRVNNFEVIRGNPDLKSTKLMNQRLSYNLYGKNFGMNASVMHKWNIDNIIDNYKVENNVMVHSYLTDGDYHNLTFGLSGSMKMLKRALNVRMGVYYSNDMITGTYATTNRWVNGFVSAFYSVGQFTFSGDFNSPYKILSSNLSLSDSPCNYGLSASWGNKGLFVEVGCKNLFYKDVHGKSRYDNPIYRYSSKNYSDAYNGMVYVKLSYSVDFGRKIAHQREEVGGPASSAILHP